MIALALFVVAIVAVYGLLYFAASRFRPDMSGMRLWAVCCVLPAILSVLFALLFAAMEPLVPASYDPMKDVNEARWTYLGLVVFGALVPTIYVVVTTLIHGFIRIVVRQP